MFEWEQWNIEDLHGHHTPRSGLDSLRKMTLRNGKLRRDCLQLPRPPAIRRGHVPNELLGPLNVCTSTSIYSTAKKCTERPLWAGAPDGTWGRVPGERGFTEPSRWSAHLLHGVTHVTQSEYCSPWQCETGSSQPCRYWHLPAPPTFLGREASCVHYLMHPRESTPSYFKTRNEVLWRLLECIYWMEKDGDHAHVLPWIKYVSVLTWWCL